MRYWPFFGGMISNSSVPLRQQPHRTYLTGAPDTAAMSLASNLDAPSQQRESAAAAYSGWRASTIVLLLFVVVATLSAIRKDVTFGFDEVAHVSYVAHLQSTHEIWPAFAEMRMLDASTFRFTDVPNYLDHPSVYYWLLAQIGPASKAIPRRFFSTGSSM
jgi:hypothetical protein